MKWLSFDVVIPDVVDDLLLGAARVAERGPAAEDARLGPRRILGRRAAEEPVVLHALLPEILALVAPFEIELDHVLVIALRPSAIQSNFNQSKVNQIVQLCNYAIMQLREIRDAV